MAASTGTRTLLTIAAGGVLLTASACGAGSGPTQTVTVTATPGPASGGATTEKYTSSPVPVNSSPGADPTALHPLAGGPIPEAAFELESVPGPDGAERAAVQTPSGNIHCEFGPAVHGCGVTSYRDEEQYGATDAGPHWWFDLSDGERPAIDAAAGPPPELYREHPPQVLDYGEVAYLGDDVCASEPEGLTCWNAQTGHGVFMSRGGYQTF